MKLYSNDDIRKLGPCYDPAKYCSDDEEYTLIDILDCEDIPANDKIWVVTKLIPEKEARLFAVWCAREALKLIDNPDPRSIEACNVAEKFAHGKATIEELRATYRDATYAADATDVADATYYAAYAARAAVWDVAADVAALSAAYAADTAGAAGKKQIDKLKEMVLNLGEEK